MFDSLMTQAANLKTLQFQNQYQALVLKKMMNQQELSGQAAVKLIEGASVKPPEPQSPVGQNIDVIA